MIPRKSDQIDAAPRLKTRSSTGKIECIRRMHNPTLEDFLRRAHHEFDFLVKEFGFQEQPSPKRRRGDPFQVRYRSGTTLVVVEGINWGYGVNVLLGPRRQRILRPEDTFPLWPIVKLRRPELADRLAIGDQLDQLAAWATALRESAEDVLRGDLSIRAEAERIARDGASRHAFEEQAASAKWRYRIDVEKANEAFRAKDYPAVVASLIKHGVRLTRAERAKLEYARKKCR